MKGKFEKNLNGTQMNADFQDVNKQNIFLVFAYANLRP